MSRKGQALGGAIVKTHREVKAAVLTHQGRVRSHNEDAWVCDPRRGVFAVIDGMGGEKAGEVAAAFVRDAFATHPDPREAIQVANAAIIEHGLSDPDVAGMGAVVTAVRIEGDLLDVGHVGDTRAYLVSEAGCEQLTRDHTAVAQAQETYGMTERQARSVAGRHQVTRDVGREIHPDLRWIDHSMVAFAEGDLLVLCTDGLHDLVDGTELAQILAKSRREGEAPEALVSGLVTLALERGGIDNVTVVAVRLGKHPSKRMNLQRILPRLGGAPGVLLSVLLAVITVFVLWIGLRDTRYDLVVQGVTRARAGSIVAEGPAGLTGWMDADGPFVALGLLFVDSPESVTRVARTPEMRGGEFRFLASQAHWQLQVEEGASLVLRQVAVRGEAPDVRVILEAGSRLVLRSCAMDLKSLTVQGPGRFEVDGGRVRLLAQPDQPITSRGAELVGLQWIDGGPSNPGGGPGTPPVDPAGS
ncbi:MAG: serine/threonine-protein phosphatase [Deltaproteobacteria bacterium]|nr:serine/threonine-protein phosphatase [Deltaproteobacteria bacterium]